MSYHSTSKSTTSNITRDISGVFTAEGNVAGARAGRLAAQRAKDRALYQAKRDAVENKHMRQQVKSINSKFKVKSTRTIEQDFKNKTTGLVTAAEYKKAKLGMQTEKERLKMIETKQLKKKKKKKKKKRKLLTLSFDAEELGDEADFESKTPRTKHAKLGKNPNVETSFLPDKDRDEAARAQTEKFKKEWMELQARKKKESLEVTYSYWDGSGHRRTIVVEKGFTIGKFLEMVRTDLMSEFHELRGVSVENLIYVKEDLMIPQHYSFYDLIASKARGKSGPLFHFDVHEDIRLRNDSRIEKDESHPGKIVARSWFERNKHIFPASRWETYDPAVQRDRYTVHGGEVRGDKAEDTEEGSEVHSVAMAGIWSIGANL